MNRLGLRLMRGFCNKQLEKINKSEILGIQGRADNTVIGGSSAAADIIIK